MFFPATMLAWGGNAYNLAAVGAAWIVADGLVTRQQPVQNQQMKNSPPSIPKTKRLA